ncbi:MAG TPA: bifunctional folylpolyglutamate synthase/dihydrofolate synthase, partial [Burkholderiaceae bacterium]|nr:bifunctional folylpolyglutamate synthase/dihydrofolate synthase [Burkholderiaceae bacterium]
ASELADVVRTAGAMRGPGVPAARVSEHGSPTAALSCALSAADPADRIVVFGSFYTVGGVLKDGAPRLQARHVGGTSAAP